MCVRERPELWLTSNAALRRTGWGGGGGGGGGCGWGFGGSNINEVLSCRGPGLTPVAVSLQRAVDPVCYKLASNGF